MNKRTRVTQALVLPRLYETMEQLMLILRQGFDVQVYTNFAEVKETFLLVASEELQKDGRAFRLATSLEELEDDRDFEAAGYLQTLYVGEEPLPVGYGFVDHPLGPLDALVSSPARMVMTILKEYGLEAYIEVFDAPKMNRLKQILRACGFGALIDAVVKTAFLCGFQGTREEVEKYLDQCATQTQDPVDGGCKVSLDFCARRFLAYVMTYGEDAHSFLKSALSYYAITARGDSASRASQMLSVSRTTMMEHLRLAESLGVPKFFDGVVGERNMPHKAFRR